MSGASKLIVALPALEPAPRSSVLAVPVKVCVKPVPLRLTLDPIPVIVGAIVAPVTVVAEIDRITS